MVKPCNWFARIWHNPRESNEIAGIFRLTPLFSAIILQPQVAATTVGREWQEWHQTTWSDLKQSPHGDWRRVETVFVAQVCAGTGLRVPRTSDELGQFLPRVLGQTVQKSVRNWDCFVRFWDVSRVFNNLLGLLLRENCFLFMHPPRFAFQPWIPGPLFCAFMPDCLLRKVWISSLEPRDSLDYLPTGKLVQFLSRATTRRAVAPWFPSCPLPCGPD